MGLMGIISGQEYAMAFLSTSNVSFSKRFILNVESQREKETETHRDRSFHALVHSPHGPIPRLGQAKPRASFMSSSWD